MKINTETHKCSHCGENPGTNEGSIVWKGFLDKDTGEKCCNTCKSWHYKNKFSNNQLRGLYSEFPLTVPQNGLKS